MYGERLSWICRHPWQNAAKMVYWYCRRRKQLKNMRIHERSRPTDDTIFAPTRQGRSAPPAAVAGAATSALQSKNIRSLPINCPFYRKFLTEPLHAGQWIGKSRSLPGQSHLRKNSGISGCTSETDFNNPVITWSEIQTDLSKLFRFTEPFAKRKGRTAETVRPSRPIASVSHYSSLWERSKVVFFHCCNYQLFF